MAYKADLRQGVWSAVCGVCGFKFNSSELKKRWDGLYVCDADYEPRNILDFFKPRVGDISVPWNQREIEPISNFVAITNTDSPYTVPNATEIIVDETGTHYFVTEADGSVYIIASGGSAYIHSMSVDATDGNVAIILPSATAYVFAHSQELIISRIDSSTNTVTVAPPGAEYLDNVAGSMNLLPLQTKHFWNDAISRWYSY